MQDREALADFEAFYERTYPAAFRVAYGVVGERDLAEDVTQDAYVSAYRDRDRYRGDGPPEAWLYRIVVHAAISAARRRRVRVVTRIAPDGDGPGPDEASITVDRLAIADGLRELDPRARSAVCMVVVVGSADQSSRRSTQTPLEVERARSSAETRSPRS